MNIVFRTDASIKIGTGHVIRCLALAQKLKNYGADCGFICRDHDGNLIKKIQSKGFKTATLSNKLSPTNTEKDLSHSNWLQTNWRHDAEQTIQALIKSPEWIIVDHYALDAKWERLIRPHCKKIMVIDDLADREHDCDLILDQNINKEIERRYIGLLPPSCLSLFGPNYALLHSEYAKLHQIIEIKSKKINRILVFFGGYDNHNLTHLVIEAFLNLKMFNLKLDVVFNKNSIYASNIKGLAQKHENITLHNNVPSLANLIQNADFAIGAGGTSVLERFCLGLPSLVITSAKNQVSIAAELHQQKFIRYLGHYDSVNKSMITESLNNLLDCESLYDWSTHCWNLVDGNGAERVSSFILIDSNTQLKTRLVSGDDEELLLRWSNDALVRKNAFNQKRISKKEHHSWFLNRLNNPSFCLIFVIETFKGIPIGNVRFEFKNDFWEISFLLDPLVRGKNLSIKMVETSIKSFRELNSEADLIGRVKKNNLASKKIFEALGFEIDKSLHEKNFYQYSLKII
ncbi:UDP-2,4-diacetamido-2,4,6-trideoxy-beta-L-altropyranose hydrolase [Candidatus Pseudothioglobus singularis]|nr:UDP-2,4-diacetamido-2,4,6-trideoxy-beta-L-altropyranose hydrolase [Candidatus Pseudothioglobus singularis]